ncbi:hypothetical protein D3C73_1477110 [compost metagenome]
MTLECLTDTPDKASPLSSITPPSIRMITALTLVMTIVNRLLSTVFKAANKNSIGTVPMENTSMDNAPYRTLPVPRAYSWMICRGPQGIRPLSMPTEKGPMREAPAVSLRAAK